MNEVPEGIGKFEISASSMKSESQRNTFSDPNSSSIKSETQRNISSDPNSMSLPSRLCECKCKVVLVQDLLECGVVQLEGANRRKAYCLFFKKDILGRNQVNQKLSTQVPVGTELLANARLIRDKAVIPFLATSVWEDGAIRDENELSKIFSSLESQEIEQYNVLSRDLEWFLPRDDGFSNDVDEGVAGDVNESNNNSTRYYHGQLRNRSPRFRHSHKRSRSPGHNSRIKSRSRSPAYHRSQASRRTRSRSPRGRPGRSKSKSPRYCQRKEKARRESSVTNAQRKQEFSDEKRIKNQRKNTEGAESFQPSRTRSRSPRNTKSKNPRYLHCQEQDTQESSSIKYKRKHNFREFSDEKKLNNEIGNIGRIKTKAVEIDYQQELKKCENQAEESLKLKRENKGSAFGCSSNTKETGESISVRHSYSKGSSPIEEDRNEDEIYRAEKSKAMKDMAIKVVNKTTEDLHKPPIHTQLIPDRGNIVNGKGKIIKILDSNYGIAIVLGFGGRLCKVLFDIYDVLIEGQVCADLGKTLHEVMQEGDLVCLHAIYIENPPISSSDKRIEYMATEVAQASSVEALLNTKLPAGNPSFLEEVSPDKIKNFRQVVKVVLATQDEEVMAKSMEKDEIPVDLGILWKRKRNVQHVDFFCFHCKHLKHSWKKHNTHVLTCQGLKCLERGEESFQRMNEEFKTKQASKESGGFNKPQSMATENEEVLQGLKCLERGEDSFQRMKEEFKSKQASKESGGFNKPQSMAKEFKRLKTSGNAGKNDSNKFHCFHCQYEGESMSHFTSKKHQDHVKDCGTKILNCPENPQITFAVNRLIGNREMLYLPKGNILSSYHRYFCLHCKEPFSDKRHLQGVKHTLHMARNSCTPTCKFVLLDDGKYVSGPGKGAKRCFICDVNLEWKNNYQAHVKGSIHSRNIFNLLKKEEHAD